MVLSGTHGTILDIVGVQGGLISAGGAFRDRGQAIPGHAGGVFVRGSVIRVQNTVVNASFVKALAGIIPGNSCHFDYPPLVIKV